MSDVVRTTLVYINKYEQKNILKNIQKYYSLNFVIGLTKILSLILKKNNIFNFTKSFDNF